MALNRIALIIKVGDQPSKLELQYKTMKEGFPISLIAERDWGQTLEEIFSDDARRVFGIVEVNPLMESYYMDMLQWLNADKETDPDLFRQRKKVLPLANLATKIGSSDLVEKLRSETDSVPMIDGRALVADDFLDAATYTTKINSIEDKNAIYGGSHNIGSGETYTTFAAFGADIGTPITSNLTGIQTSSVTETSTALFSFTLDGYKCDIKSNAASYGYPDAGYVTTINHDAVGMSITLIAANGNFELSKFYLKSTGSTSSTDALMRVGGAFAVDILLHDIMLDCDGRHNHGFRLSETVPLVEIYNLLIWDARQGGVLYDVSNTNNIIENCTSINAATWNFAFLNSYLTARNLLGLESAGSDFQGGNVTKTSCASSDATGTAGLINLTSANMVNSLDDTNEEFLNITPGSTIDGAGTTSILTENTQGIRTNARPNSSGLVSCGATESVPSGDIINLRGGFGSRLVGGFQ